MSAGANPIALSGPLTVILGALRWPRRRTYRDIQRALLAAQDDSTETKALGEAFEGVALELATWIDTEVEPGPAKADDGRVTITNGKEAIFTLGVKTGI